MTLRPLTASDVSAIAVIEAAVYEPSLHVSDEAFRRLIEIYPAGALGCFDDDGLCGYAFGVPLTAGSILDLRAPLPAVPANADVFYVHDVAVAPRCRGTGVGRVLVRRLLDLARAARFTRAELVAVQGAAPFWERFGFRAVREFEYVPGVPSTQMHADL